MKQPTLQVYNDNVFVPANGTLSVYSSIEYMKELAAMQPLALHVVFQTELAPKGGSLAAAIEHAGDGINWVPKLNSGTELPTRTFLPAQEQSFYGAEVNSAPPSHEFARIRIDVFGSAADFVAGILIVYATGQRRVTRARAVRAPGDESLSDHLRARLPAGVADHVEAFRRRAGMSDETLGELRRLWDGSGDGAPDQDRTSHVQQFLSPRARRELEHFTHQLHALPRHVVPAVRRAIGSAALDELMRPDWGKEN